MANERETGGPAFPQADYLNGSLDQYGITNYHVEGVGGMMLRDYFAAKALAGIDRETWSAMCRDAATLQARPAEVCAVFCYELADAMLKERAK